MKKLLDDIHFKNISVIEYISLLPCFLNDIEKGVREYLNRNLLQ
jgi:hypothetical protein